MPETNLQIAVADTSVRWMSYGDNSFDYGDVINLEGYNELIINQISIQPSQSRPHHRSRQTVSHRSLHGLHTGWILKLFIRGHVFFFTNGVASQQLTAAQSAMDAFVPRHLEEQ